MDRKQAAMSHLPTVGEKKNTENYLKIKKI